MHTTTSFRPYNTNLDVTVWKRFNWKWLLQRLPMLLFAIVSSYGVSHLLEMLGTPTPFHQLGGISFDIGFLGVIALADQQLTKTLLSRIYYYALNISLAGIAALFNVLSHAGGKFAEITPEAIVAGAPFALVGLAYALFYEQVMQQAIDKELAKERKEEELAERKRRTEIEREEYESANPFVCSCGERKPTKKALSNHQRYCAVHKTAKEGA